MSSEEAINNVKRIIPFPFLYAIIGVPKETPKKPNTNGMTTRAILGSLFFEHISRARALLVIYVQSRYELYCLL